MQEYEGLSTQAVEASRQEHGHNGFESKKPISFVRRWIGNFGDPMLIILMVALFASGFIQLVHYFKGEPMELLDLLGILVAILLASLTNTFFEHKNEASFQSLQASASRGMVKVYRDGSLTEVVIDEVVVGDYVLLSVGDKVPADGYVIEGHLAVDQSLLNGESKEAMKRSSSMVIKQMNENLLDEHLIFRGTTVLDGQATMEVLAVGKASVYGHIAQSLQQNQERDTPLKIKLHKLARIISYFGYVGGLAMAIIFFWREASQIGNSFEEIRFVYQNDWPKFFDHLLQALMMAVILIVVAVPEGLPLMIAIVSAMMMNRMLKDNVLVRTNSGIETAGSLNLLYTDKTGTLTKGQLEVVEIWQNGAVQPKANQALIEVILTTAQSHYSHEKQEAIGGNSTDRALMNWLMTDYKHEVSISLSRTVIAQVPFNSERKWSSATVEFDNKQLSLIKGAPERILPLCRRYYDAYTKQVVLDASMQEKINTLMAQWSQKSMRILAFAMSHDAMNEESALSGDLALLGLVAIRDEIRQEVIPAIAQVQNAGVQVVMVTGDRKETAFAIAKEVGIAKDGMMALDSAQLNLLSDDELKDNLPNIAVVARALPSDKSRLVRVAQELDLVVGMTGDGVNDSPALNSADVGFAMGSGTDVAKEASDIIVLDDNFVSIKQAILYGRTIYHNIQRFIVFQLTINLTAVLVTLIFPLLGYDPPLKITQMLWVNLVMDSLAALAFGGEAALSRYLNERPKERGESILKPFMLEQITVVALAVFGVSIYMLYSSDIHLIFPYDVVKMNAWHTAYFAFFVFAAVVNAFNVRTNRLNPLDNIQGNWLFVQVMILIVGVQILLTSVGGEVMHSYGLNWAGWFMVMALSMSIFAVGLLHKAIRTKARLRHAGGARDGHKQLKS